MIDGMSDALRYLGFLLVLIAGGGIMIGVCAMLWFTFEWLAKRLFGKEF